MEKQLTPRRADVCWKSVGWRGKCRLDCALLQKAEVLRGEGELSGWTLHVRGGIPPLHAEERSQGWNSPSVSLVCRGIRDRGRSD